MTKLFYKFLVSSNPIRFTEIELLDDDDVETMVALYCPLGRLNTKPIQLFAELEDVEPIESVTHLSQQYGVENLRTEVPRLSVHGFDIDFNVGFLNQYGGGLKICPVIIETDVLGEDFSDPDLNDVPDDIDDKGPDGANGHAPSVRNLSHGIIIRNDPGAHMSIIDPDAANASKFPEYLDIIPCHLVLEDLESEELFVGQRFVSKDECVNAIKHYSLKVSIDYRVADSKLTIYVGECWKLTKGCKWWVRVVFIQRSQK
ncbi:hypothetical protein J1N35_043613 [Gossypium stocksii]|uniref:Transposase MuDR plant domain-containing protein n=1 Tax=Gossypium stocksii TaxID=47602 RepID=A0A9D3U7L8_9ROSI|nr:hypothetical protein J1N35_043613 [Gossypium stocksii]